MYRKFPRTFPESKLMSSPPGRSLIITLIYMGYLSIEVFLPSLDIPWLARTSLLRFLDHTQTHYTRYGSSGRVIGPSQRPLPDNKKHSHETDIHASSGIRTRIPRKRAAADQHVTARPPRLAGGRKYHMWFVDC